MGRIRTLLKLGLASGATLGILALSLPRFLGDTVEVQPSGDLSATSQEAVTPTSRQRPAIAHFLGIAQFVKSPTEYGFICGLACDPTNKEAEGEVVSASLEGDRMEIEYRYPIDNTTKIGKLIGTLNSDGVFDGIYRLSEGKAQSEKAPNNASVASTQGEITFTFSADGSAQGSTDQGKGLVKIFM